MVTMMGKKTAQRRKVVIRWHIFPTRLRCTSLLAPDLTNFSSLCLKELDLIHSRLFSLDRLRLPRFAAHLQKLCLRQNFISCKTEFLKSPDFKAWGKRFAVLS